LFVFSFPLPLSFLLFKERSCALSFLSSLYNFPSFSSWDLFLFFFSFFLFFSPFSIKKILKKSFLISQFLHFGCKVFRPSYMSLPPSSPTFTGVGFLKFKADMEKFFVLHEVSGDARRALLIAEALREDAKYWYRRVYLPENETPKSAAPLYTALQKRFPEKEETPFSQKKRISALPFAGLEDFLQRFYDEAASTTLPDSELCFLLWQRLTPEYGELAQLEGEKPDPSLPTLINDIRSKIKSKEKERAFKPPLAVSSSSSSSKKPNAPTSEKKPKCRTCGKTGHLEKYCYSKTKSKKEEKSSFSFSLSSATSTLYSYPAEINGVNFKAIIDSGASSSFISTSAMQKIRAPSSPVAPGTFVKLANGAKERITRSTQIKARIFGSEETFSCQVIKMPMDLVIGADWLRRRNPTIDWSSGRLSFPELTNQEGELIASGEDTLEPDQPSEETFFLLLLENSEGLEKPVYPKEIQELLSSFDDVFPDDLPDRLPPRRNVVHHIELEENAKPPNRRPYRLSPAESEELTKQLAELKEKGFIRPSTSSFSSPILFVKKKDGSMRMCVDYRALNKITVKDRFPLPRIDELFDHLSGATIFSKIDLRSGYHQIRIAEGDIHKSAFTCSEGLFEYLVMPFGQSNAPATFMRAMHDSLKPFIGKFVLVFLDDILIYSRNMEEHLVHLRQVLQKLRDDCFYAKMSKCSFATQEVNYLGHTLSREGISTDPEKTEAIRNWPPPTNVSEIRSFLGLAGYYQRFIKNFAEIASPLSDLLKKEIPFSWTEVHQTAFDKLKTALCSAPVLTIFDPLKKLTLETDASGFAIGAVLSQEESGILKPITFISRKLNRHEKNYATHEKETLAIVYAVTKLRHYLHGPKVRVLTDHHSIRYLSTQPNLSQRQVRWVEKLQEFDLEYIYRPGKLHIPADALSRSPHLLNHMQQSDANMIRKIKESYVGDSSFSKIISSLTAPAEVPRPLTTKKYSWIDGLLYLKTGPEPRLCIPDSREIKDLILHDFHDAPIAGHPGFDKTYSAIRALYYWPLMDTEIRSYVESCDTCQKSKPRNTTKQGLLYPLNIPERSWDAISMDFITHLPESQEGNSSIMVVVDRLSKMAHFTAMKDSYSAKDVAKLFFTSVFRLHGLPSSIVSDRDSRFTGSFWRELMERIGTKLNMSTSFHPQTDGQSERTIRTLILYLRTYINFDQRNWEDLLPAAEFAYNSHRHASTSFSPFELCYGFLPKTVSLVPRGQSDTELKNASAEEISSKIQSLINRAKDRLLAAQQSQEKYANLTRKPKSFQLKDNVLLSTENLNFDGSEGTSPKLRKAFEGPFRITKVISPTTYRLALPQTWKIHPVFHISQLRQFNENPPRFASREPERPEPFDVKGEPHYEVRAIVGHKMVRGKRHFRVLWKGYPDDEGTWEPESELKTASRILRKYLRSLSGGV